MIKLNDVKKSTIDAQKLANFWFEGNKIVCDFIGCKENYVYFYYKNKKCLSCDYNKLWALAC